MYGNFLRITCLVLSLGPAAVVLGAEPFQQDAGPDALVCVEAEHYDKKFETGSNTWALVTAAAGSTATEGFSGGQAMQAMPDTPLGGRSVTTNFVQNSLRLDFQVNFVKTGTYYPWILAFGRDGNSDSAHIGIDGLAFDTSDNLSGWNNAYRWRNTTMEGPRSTFEVTTVGVHTLNLYMREDGLAFDKVVLTTNLDYTPTGHGPAESSRGIPDWATGPVPADGATDVPRVVTLAWTPGPFAATHDVYLGTSRDDVSNATRANPLGVLANQGQDANTYEPTMRFEFGKTYYWRVDEVNTPPDATVIKGNVWSLTAEPFVYQMRNIVATASSSGPGVTPQNTINGSGLNAQGLHSTAETAMWVTDKTVLPPAWIQYEFDGVYKLYEMWVWNYNHSFESLLGFGFKEVTIKYSVDGTDWKVLGDVQFVQGPSADGYAHGAPVDLQGVPAKYVQLTAKSNFSGGAQFGLSEVQFFYIPAHPREPKPAAGATGVNVDTMLSWRAGREAASHRVYLGTDQQAVTAGTALAGTSDVSRFDPGPLDFGRTYYWKVSEVNEAETIPAWDGVVWSFATQEYLVVDDFESYNDDEDKGTRIYETWIDGYADGSSGSTVGNIEPPFAEQKVVHGGKQSMPMDYNNVNAPFFSEAQRTWDTPQDWSAHGADALVLYFRGNRIGFLERSPGTITMSGVGTDIWATNDEFQFACKPLSGNGTIVAKVDSLVNTDPWAKAAVMIRESLEPNARFALICASPANGVHFQARLLNAGSATSDNTAPAVSTPEQIALRIPVWIKLERSGSNFNGFYSTDGTKWTAMSWNPQAIVTAATMYIGLAVTSHNTTGVATTAEFSSVSVTGATGAWQQVGIGVTQPDNDPDQLYVAVQDSAKHMKVIKHADPQAVLLDTWQRWSIPLADLQAGGVNLKAVKTLCIGVGDRNNPVKAGAGRVYLDDIGVGHAATP